MNERNDWKTWAERAAAKANADPEGPSALDQLFIPLLPSERIYVFCVDGDGRRFARLFRRVWGKLPASARCGLLARWRKRRQRLAGLLGEDGSCRCGITASASWMDPLSDRVVECELAYWLAHMTCCMRHGKQNAATSGKLGHLRLNEEVDALARSWGFEPDSVGSEEGPSE